MARVLSAILGLVSMLVPSLTPGPGMVALADAAESSIETVALADTGPYAIEMRDVLVSRPVDAGGDFSARLTIPLPPLLGVLPGDDTLSPVVAFGHGYLAPVELYEGTLAHLASWGITVIAPRSGGELFPSHERFAEDLADALDWVVAAGADEDWPGLAVDPAARGVSGHSMGGGAAVLAAARDPRIRAVATLAAAETLPSAVEAAGRIDAPALFLAGGDDAITPVDRHQRPMFEAMAPGTARLGTLAGGSHCGFLDTVPAMLGLVCDAGTLDPGEQRRIVRGILTVWLRTMLASPEPGAEPAWPDRLDGTPVVTWE